MTGIYATVTRGPNTTKIEIENLTDSELATFFSTQSATETKDIARHLVKCIRAKIKQDKKTPKESQLSAFDIAL